jgi:hypothetical protein
MFDPTENARRQLVHVINASLSPDEQQRYHQLCVDYGEDNVWDTDGVQREFEIIGFMAPFCVARRKADNVKGSLEFCHSPRFYFNFQVA